MRKKLLLLFALLSILLVGLGSSSQVRAIILQEGKILPDRVMVVTPFRSGTPLPARVDITDPARVQALYEAVYALPPAPKKPDFHYGPGPVSFIYTLDFYNQNHLFKRILIPTISFHGFELEPQDYRQVTREFWSLLIPTIKDAASKQ